MNDPVPPEQEQGLERIFAALSKALTVYALRDITVQLDGFASGSKWAEGRIRNDLSSGITSQVSPGTRGILRAIYQREGRPWYSSVWRLDSSGVRSWEWDFGSRPRGSGPLSNSLEMHLEDLAAFPRADRLVPLWMRPTLAVAGAWDAATDRLTLDGKGQPSGLPAVMEEPQFWYLLPIRDSPTGPRRAFGHLPPGIDEADLDLPLTGPPV